MTQHHVGSGPRLKWSTFVAVALFAAMIVGAVTRGKETPIATGLKTSDVGPLPPMTAGVARNRPRFPDFKVEYKPPEDQVPDPQNLFRLIQDYPLEPPRIETDRELQEILAIPFNENDQVQQNWLKYLLKVRDYCFAGNIEPEGIDVAKLDYANDWQQDNPVRRWYHVPWQHYGPKGREGIHGLTREASAKPGRLGATHTTEFQTHAVAVYNAIGGYTIGQVWADQFDPDPRRAIFQPGTIVAKVLFTQATEDEVPYLHDGLIWKAYVQDPQFPQDPTKRKVQKLRLLQMDVMIRDDRAKESGGWVFGTYCYNGSVKEKNKWRRLVPVGIQWGNDPEFDGWDENHEFTNPLPTATKVNRKLKQTIINESPDLPPQHLGWGGRLNGPADYFRSSCMSCHSTAQYPGRSPQHPDFKSGLGHEPGDASWKLWFRNLSCGESFDSPTATKKQAITMDFSLQLQIGIENFYQWKASTMGGYFTFRDDTHEPSSEPPK